MDRDATLEDFLDPGERSSPETGTGESADEAQSDEIPDIEEVTAPTMSHRPGSGTCAVCGAIVERRWRDDERLVCSDCKSW